MVKAKKFVYAKPFDRMPKEEDLKIVEEELPPLKDGEFLAEALYLSVDPYMRIYADRLPLGVTMIGSQVAKITESKNKDFPVGQYVFGQFGWRTHTISNGTDKGSKVPLYLVPELENHPLSVYLGVLGMPGNTAYFGFHEVCKPKAGETVAITGAGGAIGGHVGQIAKLKGCKVIGITGSDRKFEWLKTIGFDHVINYKTADVEKVLQEIAPECVHYYANISRRQGFWVTKWADRWQEGVKQNTEWLLQGKLRYRETVTQGFENMTKALVDVLKGRNTGNAVVKV